MRRPPVVLIVEDHEHTREMYAESLVFNGVRVIESMTADDAFAKAHEQCPDIISMDLGLPGGKDGVQLCEQLKSDARTRNIPVIAVTAWAMGGHTERARRAGCDSVLTKPLLPEELLREIQRLLNRPTLNRTK
jgi:two-component system cell cycle response regulator/two-component system cell cycle response regulator DivK